MGKSREQKADERSQLAGQQQQLKSNTFFMELAKQMQTLMKEREAKETSYLEGEVDPKLKGYARTGFAPGERNRARNQFSEDNARVHSGAESRALDRSGQSTDSPSGVNPYLQMQLARSRGESGSSGLRNIEEGGANRRYDVLGPMMARADRFNPLGYNQAANKGRAANIQDAKIEKGFWQELGTATARGLGSSLGSGVGAMATGGLSGGMAKLAGGGAGPSVSGMTAPQYLGPISGAGGQNRPGGYFNR